MGSAARAMSRRRGCRPAKRGISRGKRVFGRAMSPHDIFAAEPCRAVNFVANGFQERSIRSSCHVFKVPVRAMSWRNGFERRETTLEVEPWMMAGFMFRESRLVESLKNRSPC
ncbi:hypothetical protein N7461_002627 [Penicillium sp. DV-2018c]|nr:hypothetical protein N7461_002627 [Penicillium sp. DV-2018c]